METQDYTVISAPGEGEVIEKRSRFIAGAYPVSDEEQVNEKLTEIRKKYHDARHHCYAYVLREEGKYRYSDDGEPQGTAGRPILDVIGGSGVLDCLIVVTRYFGGTLLGTGGLVRAYTAAAVLALENAEKTVVVPQTAGTLRCEYSFYGKLETILERYDCKKLDTTFGEAIELILSVRSTQFDALAAEIYDLSAGRVTLIPAGDGPESK